MKLTAKSGSMLAATAAAMLLSGVVGAPIARADDAIGMCMGANACKGRGSCKGANNACKGQAACKGQGYVLLTQEQCHQIGDYQWMVKK